MAVMRSFFVSVTSLVLLAFICLVASACAPSRAAEFWRPISEPNLQMPLEKAQLKLDFDISQCQCGIFPTNIPHSDLIEFQPDQQRMVQTGAFFNSTKERPCTRKPGFVVQECMRGRGWEVTKCAGRVPVAGAGEVCTATLF